MSQQSAVDSVQPSRKDQALEVAGRAWSEGLAPLVGDAAKGFATVLIGVFALTLALAVSAGVIASAAGIWLTMLVVVATLAGGAGAAAVLAPKRATTLAIVRGLRSASLGRHSCELVFSRLLRVDDEQWHGERGVALAQRAERLPLAQAERRLSLVVDRIIAEPTSDRGLRAALRRRMRGLLLDRVATITLASFRRQGQQHGGVNLAEVRAQLTEQIDQLLVEHFEGASATLSAMAIGALVIGSLGLAVAVRLLA